MFALIEMHYHQRARELWELGNVIALAYHEPKRLKDIIPKTPFDESSIPAMLRIPKAKHG